MSPKVQQLEPARRTGKPKVERRASPAPVAVPEIQDPLVAEALERSRFLRSYLEAEEKALERGEREQPEREDHLRLLRRWYGETFGVRPGVMVDARIQFVNGIAFYGHKPRRGEEEPSVRRARQLQGARYVAERVAERIPEIAAKMREPDRISKIATAIDKWERGRGQWPAIVAAWEGIEDGSVEAGLAADLFQKPWSRRGGSREADPTRSATAGVLVPGHGCALCGTRGRLMLFTMSATSSAPPVVAYGLCLKCAALPEAQSEVTALFAQRAPATAPNVEAPKGRRRFKTPNADAVAARPLGSTKSKTTRLAGAAHTKG